MIKQMFVCLFLFGLNKTITLIHKSFDLIIVVMKCRIFVGYKQDLIQRFKG